MLRESVIDRQVTRQPMVAFLRVLEGHSVGPFPAEGLNEPIGLAIGPGHGSRPLQCCKYLGTSTPA